MAPNEVESVEISQTASPLFYFVPQCNHFWMLIIMYTNGYYSIPVMAGLKKRKNKLKKLKKNQRV